MHRKLVVAVALFGVLTAGCEMRADFRLELAADESGRVVASIGLDEEFQALVESSGEPIQDSFFGSDDPFGELPGAEERTYEEGDFTYYEASVPFSDLSALRLLGTDADNFLSDFDITVDEESASVTGTFDLAELTGGDLADDELAGIETDALAAIFQLHIQVDMPGKVTSQNADRVLDDGSLEWDIPLIGDVQSLSIVAKSDLTSGGGMPTWLIFLIILGLVILVVYLIKRSTGSTDQPSVDAAAVPGPAVTEVSAVDTPAAAPRPPVTEIPDVTPGDSAPEA